MASPFLAISAFLCGQIVFPRRVKGHICSYCTNVGMGYNGFSKDFYEQNLD